MESSRARVSLTRARAYPDRAPHPERRNWSTTIAEPRAACVGPAAASPRRRGTRMRTSAHEAGAFGDARLAVLPDWW